MCLNEWKDGKSRRQKGHFGSRSSCILIQHLKHNIPQETWVAKNAIYLILVAQSGNIANLGRKKSQHS